MNYINEARKIITDCYAAVKQRKNSARATSRRATPAS